ncbi:MAG: hypothetical protein AVDCRST_MAG58-2969, partial [uncultured Rubrobacteraceae bacterium]
GRISLCADALRCARMWGGSRGLLRLFGLRDEGVRPSAGSAGHRRHAGYKRGGGHSGLYGSALRNGPGLRRADRLFALGVGRALRRVPAHRRRVVSARCDRADRRLPRAAQRGPGDRGAAWCWRRGPLVTLSPGLDRVEPPAVRRGSRGVRHAGNRAAYRL